jgi:hypothetical protein
VNKICLRNSNAHIQGKIKRWQSLLNSKVKVTRSKIKFPIEDFVTRNVHVKYKPYISNQPRDIANIKDFAYHKTDRQMENQMDGKSKNYMPQIFPCRT